MSTFLERFDWLRPDYDAIWTARMACLAGLRAEPERWAGLKAHYRENPCDFITDWGVTFNPKNAGTYIPTAMPFLLFPKQRQFIEWLHDRLRERENGLVEKSRDMGASWLCVAFAVWAWLFIPGSIVGFGSRKEDLVDRIGDPDSLFWKIRTFISLLPAELQPKRYDPKKHAPFMRVVNPDPGMESVIRGEAGDNIGRGGRATVYFGDEHAFWEHAEDCDASLSQNTNVQIDVSTPNGEGNPFWRKAHDGKTKKFVFDWRDDPRKGPGWYETQKGKMTPTALAAEVDRDYSASISNSFIAGTLVTNAAHRGPGDVPVTGGLRVGLDVARFGDDNCVLTFRRGRVLLKQITWGKTSISGSYGRAKQEILRFKVKPEQIAVDVIGLGAGVADLLRDDPTFGDGQGGSIVVDVNSSLPMGNGEQYNLRAFMWQQMRDWLETASIPNTPDLRVSLTSTRYGYRGGLLLLESKEDMKKRGIKSPDEGDSLALTFAYPGVKRRPAMPRPDQITVYETDAEMGM